MLKTSTLLIISVKNVLKVTMAGTIGRLKFTGKEVF